MLESVIVLGMRHRLCDIGAIIQLFVTKIREPRLKRMEMRNPQDGTEVWGQPWQYEGHIALVIPATHKFQSNISARQAGCDELHTQPSG